jgi:hypothetical protein
MHACHSASTDYLRFTALRNSKYAKPKYAKPLYSVHPKLLLLAVTVRSLTNTLYIN